MTNTESQNKGLEIFKAGESWALLALGSLITSSATRNLAVIELLMRPVQIAGVIGESNGKTVGQATVPSWFPTADAILQTNGGEICTKLKEVAVVQQLQPAQENTQLLLMDLGVLSLPASTRAFTLTYSPWFRFMAEPLSFSIVGRMAAYVAEIFRFALVRDGIEASILTQPDACIVSTPDGTRIEVTGMTALARVRLVAGDAESTFNLTEFGIEIDERMFPACYAAGCDLLKSGDKLINVDVTQVGHRLKLVARPEARNV